EAPSSGAINVDSDGNVGIGTSTPQATLDVSGDIIGLSARFKTDNYHSLNIGKAIYGNNLGVWGSSYIGFNMYREIDNSWKTEYDSFSNGGAMIYGTVGGSIVFTCVQNDQSVSGQQILNEDQIKNKAKMILQGDGLLKANEIEIQLDVWSDYVFNEDYNLPELKEVEIFIKENKHLPDVPSEAEVLEDGVNLGEMDAILLKKIEELTLYLIEQQKEIDVLKEKVEK
nr:hypothetical protein [Bacteroidota bacterium]